MDKFVFSEECFGAFFLVSKLFIEISVGSSAYLLELG